LHLLLLNPYLTLRAFTVRSLSLLLQFEMVPSLMIVHYGNSRGQIDRAPIPFKYEECSAQK
jgi:hypothetical protein